MKTHQRYKLTYKQLVEDKPTGLMDLREYVRYYQRESSAREEAADLILNATSHSVVSVDVRPTYYDPVVYGEVSE